MKNGISMLSVSLMLCMSCETNSKSDNISIEKKQDTQPTEVKVITNKEIESLVNEYNSKSDTSKIRFTDSIGCGSQSNMEFYSKGIYVYSIFEIKKQKFDYNGDHVEDFVISYKADNCWKGNGAGNYLSNYIFATSKDNTLQINKELTDSFRKAFENYVRTNFGNFEDVYTGKAMFINGIEFKNSNGPSVSGIFNINTPKCSTSQPCVSGEFDFHTKSGKIEFKNITSP